MSNLNRRRFLEDSLLIAASAVGASACQTSTDVRSSARKDGKLNVAVIGLRGRGRAHIKAFQNSPDAHVATICDVDDAIIEPAAAAVPGAKYVRDMRKIFDDPAIDAVSFATPNHWHALGTIWALEAGKHVYVEKPISYNIEEGKAVVRAAKASGLVVQHGTQARSHRATREAIEWMRSGGLGKPTLAVGLCYKKRPSIGKVTEDQEPPATLDYDQWIGPADKRPLRREKLHYDWHWDYNTGNGDLGNQGVHQMDIARWGLGLDALPKRVISCGGRLGYDDDADTPNTLVSTFDYGTRQLVFEVRGLRTGAYRDVTIGVVFHCEGGYLAIASYDRCTAFDTSGREIRTFQGGGNHFQNFLDAVKAGDPEAVTANSREGHLSAGLCHMGNVSYRMGKPMDLARAIDPFGSDWPAGNEAMLRMRSHLVGNYVSPADSVLVGPELVFDPATEMFVGDRAAEANALSARKYRSRYVPPSIS